MSDRYPFKFRVRFPNGEVGEYPRHGGQERKYATLFRDHEAVKAGEQFTVIAWCERPSEAEAEGKRWVEQFGGDYVVRVASVLQTVALKFYAAIAEMRWCFEIDGWLYSAVVASAAGWMFDAPEEDLRWAPEPSVEVRRIRPNAFSDWKTVTRLPIPGASKRYGATRDQAEPIIQDYADRLANPS